MFRNYLLCIFEPINGTFTIYRRDIIAELIAKTKQQRYDKKLARDEREDATERLDEKWSKIRQTDAIAGFVKPVKDKSIIDRPEKDDYDHLVSQIPNLK